MKLLTLPNQQLVNTLVSWIWLTIFSVQYSFPQAFSHSLPSCLKGHNTSLTQMFRECLHNPAIAHNFCRQNLKCLDFLEEHRYDITLMNPPPKSFTGHTHSGHANAKELTKRIGHFSTHTANSCCLS